MFRMLILSLFLLISAPWTSPLLAQDGDDKPTEILPDNNEVMPDMSTGQNPDDVIADVPLILEQRQGTENSMFVIGAVQISGAITLKQAEFSTAIEGFVGQKAEAKVLQALARSVADRARMRGYLFASALVPAQSVRLGVVRVLLDEGVVHEVKIEGTDNRFVKHLFAQLAGHPGKRDAVEQAVLLAGDLYGFSVDKVSFIRKADKGILRVRLSNTDQELHATMDNYGRRAADQIRGRVEVEMGSVFTDSDWLHTQVLTTLTNPQNLLFVSGSYSNMFTTDGKTISLTGGAGKTRRQYGDGTWSKSTSRYASVKFSAPVLRTHAASMWLNLEAAHLSVDRFYSDSVPSRDVVTSLTASANGSGKLAGGRVSGGISATRGLDILGATRANDPDASQLDASAIFTKGELWLNWNRKLGKGFSIRSVMNAQIASRPLLSSQEIDLGGPRIGRGFNYSEKSGDQGVIALAELRKYFDQPAKGISSLQLYTFVDGGYIHDLRRTNSGSSLVSSGAGVRLGLGKAELALELAVPVKGMRNNNKSPQLNVALGFSF